MHDRNTYCVPLKYRTFEEVVNSAKEAEKEGASMVEIWLDSLPFTYEQSRKDRKLLDELFSLVNLPIICVNKGEDERGNFKGSQEDKVRLLCKAVLAGVDYVDIGIGIDEKLIAELKNTIEENAGLTRLIISYHNFEKTPEFEKLKEVVKKSCALGADIVKIATFATQDEDNDTIFKTLDFIHKQGKKGVGLCMGDLGKRSRLEVCDHGSLWTYTALNEEQKTAPGQLIIKELL